MIMGIVQGGWKFDDNVFTADAFAGIVKLKTPLEDRDNPTGPKLTHVVTFARSSKRMWLNTAQANLFEEWWGMARPVTSVPASALPVEPQPIASRASRAVALVTRSRKITRRMELVSAQYSRAIRAPQPKNSTDG